MKKIGLVLLMLTLSAIGLFAGEKGVVKVIPAPDFPYGLAYDGTYLWVGTSYANSNGDFLWKIDPSDGSVVGSIPIPYSYQFYTIKALAYDGQNLWVFEDISGTDKFFKVDPNTGAVLKSFNSPVTNYVGGMAYADGFLWISQYYASSPPRDILIKMDTTGVPVDTIVAVGEQPMGVAFDGQFIWCAEDTGYGSSRQEIYKYDPVTGAYTGEFIRNPDDSPRDMAWDGQYLWLIGYHTTNSKIYQIAITGGTPDIELPVTSVDFGLTAVGDTAHFPFTILNTGDDTLRIDSMSIDADLFSLNSVSFPLLIPGGSQTVVDLMFTPDTIGLFQGNLQIYSNDPDEPVVTVLLTGQGQFIGPRIWLSDTFHDFGDVWVPMEGKAKWILHIANVGTQNLEIVDLILTQPQFSVGNVSVYPITLAPGDTFDLVLYFQPDDTLLYRDSLAVASTDNQFPFVFVQLQGRGVLGDYSMGHIFWDYQVPAHPQAGSYQEYEVDGLRAINDINNDGVAEVIAATENYWILCLDGNGNGGTDTLWTFSTYISNYSAGSIGGTNDYGVQDALAIASDLNGDGFNDVVIATGGGNEHVYALNGTNGEILWQYGTDDPGSYGLGDFQAVDARRDFTGDGIPDVLAIADGNNLGTGYQKAFLFNGSNGNIIWTYSYPGPNPSFGKSVISIDDVTGDGVPDAIIAVGNNGSTDLATYCLNGATGTVVWSRDAVQYEPKELVELPITGETPDVVVAEYFSTIRRLDGETGGVVWSYYFGGLSGIIQMRRIPDVDDDGIDDIVLATFTNAATCLSGATGNPLWFYAMDFQYDVAVTNDLNGDGYSDVILASGTNNPTNGAFYCLNGKTGQPLFSTQLTGDRFNTVSVMPSIDGNSSNELLAATKYGQIFCYSGGVLTAIDHDGTQEEIPYSYQLNQNYPNPFNPATTISFTLSERSVVTLRVFNVLGQEVARLLNKRILSAGEHEVIFRAEGLPSGVYLYRLETERGVQIRKMILMK